jgi:hypothetical protein
MDRIEHRITQLVQRAPDADAQVVAELLADLGRVGSPLARAIARVIELIAARQIDPGIALPPLAMACATLADAARGALGERELEAARYEIETLLPVPARPSRPAVDAPVIPIDALVRRGP